MITENQGIKKILKDTISKNGAISFKDFMKICLYEPTYGYYSQNELPIGKHGDFVTAPHTSRLFGYLLAVQIRQFFQMLPDDHELLLCEFGAGTGFLAKDILDFYKDFHCNIYERIKYLIVEPLPARRNILSKKLQAHGSKLEIVDDFSEVAPFTGVVVANELWDAFPVHLIENRESGFLEIFIDLDKEGNLVEKAKNIRNKELKRYVENYLKDLPTGYRTEINLEMKHWINNFSSLFKKGFAIFIDYGYSKEEYYAPYRNRGTLLGYTRQQVTEGFLDFPGLIDITAHVNFSDAKEWFEENGFNIEGFCPQWAFLGGLDIEDTINKAFGRLEPFSPVLATVKSLIFPQGMGQTHKVFVVSKAVERTEDIKGFKMKNDLERLT